MIIIECLHKWWHSKSKLFIFYFSVPKNPWPLSFKKKYLILSEMKNHNRLGYFSYIEGYWKTIRSKVFLRKHDVIFYRKNNLRYDVIDKWLFFNNWSNLYGIGQLNSTSKRMNCLATYRNFYLIFILARY